MLINAVLIKKTCTLQCGPRLGVSWKPENKFNKEQNTNNFVRSWLTGKK